jgi:hypothetical protein
MSHFAILVKIPDTVVKQNGGPEEAIAALLAPYQENNMGDCPDKYLEFEDTTADLKKKYATEGSRRIRLPDGEVVDPWDDRFRVPGTFGHGGGTHEIPDDCEEFELPHKEQYATFEEFVEEWSGEKPCGPNGEYGYYHNPNAKWDWYSVGGRWSGYFPIKDDNGILGSTGTMGSKMNDGPGFADICQVKDLDLKKIQADAQEQIDKFCAAWEWYDYGRVEAEVKDGDWEDYNRKESGRHFALSVGILDCKNEDELTGDEWLIIPWAKDPKRYDVWANGPITGEDIRTKYAWHFAPLKIYAVLDDKSWNGRGDMGWWGCSTSEDSQEKEYGDGWFEREIMALPQDMWLAAVDCHI